jgi:hypothetical protein
MKKVFVLALLVILPPAAQVRAYGPDGHMIIGAIADNRLAKTPTAAAVSELLDGYTLREASIMADTIKQWDKPGVEDPKVQKYFSSHPKIAEQLRAFWMANPPVPEGNTGEKPVNPSQHWFHYTDVPLEGGEKYGDGTAGRSEWDIVHMMGYCIEVLRGERPETNQRKITRPIAVILLAHFVGDIHQPLHVGAQYFNAEGHPVNPAKVRESFPDEGGNSLRLKLADAEPRKHAPKLHGFWDNDAVMANLPQFPDTMPKEERRAQMDAAEKELTDRLSKDEPKNWRMPKDLGVEKYPEAWANEILPLAREAHERLRYHGIKPKLDKETMVADGEVVERGLSGDVPYRKWTAGVVLEEMHKAGWRLAALLEKVVAPPKAMVTPTPSPTESVSPTPSPAEPSNS